MMVFKDEELQDYYDTIVTVESIKAYYRGRPDLTREQFVEMVDAA